MNSNHLALQAKFYAESGSWARAADLYSQASAVRLTEGGRGANRESAAYDSKADSCLGSANFLAVVRH